MKVVIDEEVYRKVMFWVDRAKTLEVSGLGLIKIEPDGVFRVTSAMLLPQKNGATHTDIEGDAAARAMWELRAHEGELKWWWHSHVDMGVFWSGTDKATIKEYGQGGWVVATVFNKKREKKSAFYSVDGTKTPFGTSSLFVDDLETSISSPGIEASWEQEYVANVEDFMRQNQAKSSFDADYGAWCDTYMNIGGLPPSRPEGLSKREWKKLKKVSRESRPPAALPMSEPIDDYGFDQGEREFLAREGYDIHDIDFMVEQDFTPNEIMKLAEYGFVCEEIRQQIICNQSTRESIMQELNELTKWSGLEYGEQ